ncbi:MAG: AMP-binding protein [Candidatus Hydrogenedentes bacterium]|jgi:fatty-acyl-CoA synthase|nr:AMP-binding protein [Candidatus Hydrogenedentota bacterium]
MVNETKPWVDGLTFSQVLRKTVERHGDRDAVVFPGIDHRWSFTQFEAKIVKTARALMALDVGRGDHVGIWATNWPEWILAQFATAHMGSVLVNVNPAYRTHELAYILNQADIKALLITGTHKTSDYGQMVAEVVPAVAAANRGEALESSEFASLRHVVSIKNASACEGIWRWRDFIDHGKKIPESDMEILTRQVQATDPVNIQYTSGTTGDPKGATLTHRNLLMNAYHVGQRQHFTVEDRVCIPVPFYHCFGCVMGTLVCAVYGSAMVIPAESFEAEATLRAVELEECTALYGVPTMFSAQVHLEDFSSFDLGSLRTGIMAGSPCPIELMRTVTKDMNLTEMTIAYGQTEASPVITQSRTTDSLEARVTTVGSVLPGLEVRLVDPDSGKDVRRGEQGELWARGHCVMLGYYKKPEATAAAIDEDGWLHTGDLATQTLGGDYKITGRIKDMIIRGGENIYPREIEEFLLTNPHIRQAQVVGLPDAHYVEQVSAWLVLDGAVALTEDDVKDFCKGKIAHYKIPYYVQFLDEYPLTVTGKVQKFKLRDMGVERFGLDDAKNTEMA